MDISQNSEIRQLAKVQFMAIVGNLMPQGAPNYLKVVRYTAIEKLKAEIGYSKLFIMLSVLIRDFCSSLNVVRNMNSEQIMDATAMLLEECGNFRLEDYVMMFQMAKKGNLVKIYDRIDLQTITAILDAYWLKRNEAGREAQEAEYQGIETVTGNHILGEWVNPDERGSKDTESMAQLTAKLAMQEKK